MPASSSKRPSLAMAKLLPRAVELCPAPSPVLDAASSSHLRKQLNEIISEQRKLRVIAKTLHDGEFGELNTDEIDLIEEVTERKDVLRLRIETYRRDINLAIENQRKGVRGFLEPAQFGIGQRLVNHDSMSTEDLKMELHLVETVELVNRQGREDAQAYREAIHAILAVRNGKDAEHNLPKARSGFTPINGAEAASKAWKTTPTSKFTTTNAEKGKEANNTNARLDKRVQLQTQPSVPKPGRKPLPSTPRMTCGGTRTAWKDLQTARDEAVYETADSGKLVAPNARNSADPANPGNPGNPGQSVSGPSDPAENNLESSINKLEISGQKQGEKRTHSQRQSTGNNEEPRPKRSRKN
ncbi:hypothetical protein GGR50DRAFT_122256 [Xylaria sp. CBS 124048]|nr:hypothetical protein GGR50DRAFT_122256 [Xylaria sp. CBS 124048]